ncbi:hypothetical protein [Lentilactobacillus kosonis]|uniref:Uncharacterized protein n=1 Tax=Lentilactobacillus kosonis TaxID=2810561 RepID=A0A401FNS1_9LACO|nr:hypothetical protein [Lentilactobacillus kosonis]GAY74030.1 hypothetical protein NBRC111893_2176 [Lentilactobacillus kosonis]
MGRLTYVIGANSNQIGKSLSSMLSDNKRNTVTSNGVKFKVGYTLTEGYIYITKSNQ